MRIESGNFNFQLLIAKGQLLISFVRQRTEVAMICISINQESRRLAMADMVNAKGFGAEVLEVRLDRFGKSPEIA